MLRKAFACCSKCLLKQCGVPRVGQILLVIHAKFSWFCLLMILVYILSPSLHRTDNWSPKHLKFCTLTLRNAMQRSSAQPGCACVMVLSWLCVGNEDGFWQLPWYLWEVLESSRMASKISLFVFWRYWEVLKHVEHHVGKLFFWVKYVFNNKGKYLVYWVTIR